MARWGNLIMFVALVVGHEVAAAARVMPAGGGIGLTDQKNLMRFCSCMGGFCYGMPFAKMCTGGGSAGGANGIGGMCGNTGVCATLPGATGNSVYGGTGGDDPTYPYP